MLATGCLASDKESLSLLLVFFTELNIFWNSQQLYRSLEIIAICSVGNFTFNVKKSFAFFFNGPDLVVVEIVILAAHASIVTGIVVEFCVHIESDFFIVPVTITFIGEVVAAASFKFENGCWDTNIVELIHFFL